MEWIAINDGLPPLDTPVLIYSRSSREIPVINLGWCEVEGVFQGSNLGHEGDSDVDPDVTHWMPLPEPPKVK